MNTYNILPLELPSVSGPVLSIVLHDKRIIAGYSSEERKSLRIWNPEGGLCVKTINGWQGTSQCIALAVHENYIFSSYNDLTGPIQLNHSKTGDKLDCFKIYDSFAIEFGSDTGLAKTFVMSLAVNSDYVAAASWSGGVKVYKWSGEGSKWSGEGKDKIPCLTEPEKELCPDVGNAGKPVTLGFSTNLLFRAFKDTIKCLNTEANFEFNDWGPKFDGQITDMATSWSYVAVVHNKVRFVKHKKAGETGTVEVFDPETGKLEFKIQMEEGDTFNCCAIEYDTLAVAGSSNKVRIIDLEKGSSTYGKIMQELHVPDNDVIKDIDLSYEMVVCGGKSGKIYMYARKEKGSCIKGYEQANPQLKF